MLEAGISAAIAAVSGLFIYARTVSTRFDRMDNRLDKIELRVVETYVPRTEISALFNRFEDHMNRIEDKLDNLVQRTNS